MTRWAVVAWLLAAVLSAVLAGCSRHRSSEELLTLAHEHEQAGEYRAAMIELKNLLQQEPENARGRLMLGRVLVELGDFASATKELDTARTLGISDAELRLPLAQSLLGQRDFAKLVEVIDPEQGATPAEQADLWQAVAEAHQGLGNAALALAAYEAVLALEPGDRAALLGRASAIYTLQGFDAGRAQVQRIIDVHPDHAPAWNLLGALLLSTSNVPAAVDAFTQGAKVAEKNHDRRAQVMALAGLADAQMGLMQLEDAQHSIDALNEVEPQSGLALYLQARVEFMKRDYEKAQLLLQQILSVNPENQQARLLIGAVHYAAGELSLADMYLTTVVADSPDNLFARQLLTLTRLREEKPEQALEALLPALERTTDLPRVLGLAARAQLQAGEFPDAIEYLERGTRSSPEDRQRQIALGAAYVAARRSSEARQVLERVPRNRQGPDAREYLLMLSLLGAGDRAAAARVGDEVEAAETREPALLLLAARTAAESGDLPAARRRFARVLELEPRQINALVGMAQFELASGNADAAERALRQALEISPQTTAPKIVMASVALSRKDAKAAAGWLESAIAGEPRAIEPRLLLTQHHMALGDLAKARSTIDEALRVAPDDPRALNTLAVLLAASGEQEKSREALQRAIVQAPDSIGYRLNLARAYRLAGRHQEALAEAKSALALEPTSLAALILAGTLAVQQKDFGLAGEMADRLRRVPAGQAAADVITGSVAMAQQRYPAAIAAFEHALAKNPSTELVLGVFEARRAAATPQPGKVLQDWLVKHPDDQRVRLALAQTQQAKGQRREAIENYERLLEQDAQNAAALNNLAWLYHEQGEAARALSLAERAVALEPRSAAVLDTYGWLLTQGGKVEQGLEVLQRAAEAQGAGPAVELHFVDALVGAGRNAEARARLERLLASNAITPATRREANALMERAERRNN